MHVGNASDGSIGCRAPRSDSFPAIRIVGDSHFAQANVTSLARRSAYEWRPMIMRSWAAALMLLAALGGAQAGPLAVVELFTSQSCSLCPPADAAMRELARRPDVIALTLSVDYWDYLGWKD